MAAKDCQSSTSSESATAGRVRLTLCQTKESAQDSLSLVTKSNLVVNNASSKFLFSQNWAFFIVKTPKSVCLLWPTQEIFAKKNPTFSSPRYKPDWCGRKCKFLPYRTIWGGKGQICPLLCWGHFLPSQRKIQMQIWNTNISTNTNKMQMQMQIQIQRQMQIQIQMQINTFL